MFFIPKSRILLRYKWCTVVAERQFLLFLLFARKCLRWYKRPAIHSVDPDVSGPVFVIFQLLFMRYIICPCKGTIYFFSQMSNLRFCTLGLFKTWHSWINISFPGVRIMSVSVVSIQELVFLVMPPRSGITGAACGLWSQSELYKVAYCLSMWINPNSELTVSLQRHGQHHSLVPFSWAQMSFQGKGIVSLPARTSQWCFFVSNIFMYVKSFDALCIF